MPHAEALVYAPLTEAHLEGVVALCRALSWPSYSEPSSAWRALSAPGAVTWVAVDGTVVAGLAHLLSDGLIQAHLSLVGVLPAYRRRGHARRLIEEAFRGAGAKWLDLVAESGSEEFYRSFHHEARPGFRIYPGEPGV